MARRARNGPGAAEPEDDQQSGPRALRASLLPRGTKRRRAARVGIQVARDARTYGQTLRQLWAVAQDAPATSPYQTWLRAHRATDAELGAQRAQLRTSPPVRFRIVIDASTTTSAVRGDALSATIAALGEQTVSAWNAIVVGAGLPAAASGHRITTAPSTMHAVTNDTVSFGPAPSAEPEPPTSATDAAIELVLFLEAGDLLEPDALFHLAMRAVDDPALDALTWDDDVLVRDGPADEHFEDPRFRARWSPEALLGRDPIGRSFAVRRELLTALPDRHAGPPAPDDDRADGRWWDLAARLDLAPDRVRHVPRVLVHLHQRPQVRADVATAIVRDHLARQGRSARVAPDGRCIHVSWTFDQAPSASILIPTRHNRELLGPCLTALARSQHPSFEVIVIDNGERTPDNEAWYERERRRLHLDLQVHWWSEPFNYSAVNNEAARHATGDVLVFLNDDTEARDPQWLAELVGWAVQPDIGVAGMHLIRPDGTLQHAGVVLGMGGYADHLFEGMRPDSDTVFGPTRSYRNFLAVTAACAAISRERFDALGGFDERFVLCGSDVKLGLDAVLRGWRNVCTPFAAVVHNESATRGTAVPEQDFFASWWPYQRWLRAGDPHYSPNLSLQSREPVLRAQDEESPLVRVGGIIHRPLAPKVGTTQWADEDHARWLVERCNVDDAVIQDIADLHAANPGPMDVERVAWWMPDLESPFYGGIHTALRIADLLARDHGVTNSFVVAADPNEPFVRSAIAAAFPRLADAPITFIDDPAQVDRAPETDVAIATLWETAYLMARAPGARRKAYLIQDYEPGFYPAGTKAALAEESYRFGLYGVANTHHMGELYRGRFGGTTHSFAPAVDRTLLHADGRRPLDHDADDGQPVTIFVYARPGHPRNCWELAAPALREVKARLGNGVRIVTAGSWATPDDLGGGIEHLGFLDVREYSELYRTTDVGLTLQVSEHPSYLPLELMACGVPIVAFDHRAADWLLRHDENSIRTRRTKDGLVGGLMRAATDPALRVRLGAQAAADIDERHSNWDDALAGVYDFLCDPT
jgi:GT2 family glycosyltransferase/glycosyltransferase involved in cell wall biosynthesis